MAGRRRFERRINFWENFSFDVTGDAIFVATVVVDARRYLVAGTYDENLPEQNMSLESVGCMEAYKGEIAVCFFAQRQTERFLEGIPFYGSPKKKDDALCRVLKAYVQFSHPALAQRQRI